MIQFSTYCTHKDHSDGRPDFKNAYCVYCGETALEGISINGVRVHYCECADALAENKLNNKIEDIGRVINKMHNDAFKKKNRMDYEKELASTHRELKLKYNIED